MKPEDKLKKELAEFESLVDEVKGDCDACSQHCRDRLLILDSQIEALRQVEGEYRGTLAEMFKVLDQLRAVHSINMRVLNIVAPKAGEKRWQKENSSSRCRTLGALSKKTN